MNIIPYPCAICCIIVITKETALSYGCSGAVLRSSGISYDVLLFPLGIEWVTSSKLTCFRLISNALTLASILPSDFKDSSCFT
ncbi:MAG TPA: hypothetical protein EYP87_01950 [Flavobacteriaceae bacterium]|nr:hypothetical protein [Flavobacteriaceae bacterium]